MKSLRQVWAAAQRNPMREAPEEKQPTEQTLRSKVYESSAGQSAEYVKTTQK